MQCNLLRQIAHVFCMSLSVFGLGVEMERAIQSHIACDQIQWILNWKVNALQGKEPEWTWRKENDSIKCRPFRTVDTVIHSRILPRRESFDGVVRGFVTGNISLTHYSSMNASSIQPQKKIITGSVLAENLSLTFIHHVHFDGGEWDGWSRVLDEMTHKNVTEIN